MRHRRHPARQLAAAADRPVPQRPARRPRVHADPVGARHRARVPAERAAGTGAHLALAAAELAGDRAGLRRARRAAADDHPVGVLPGAAADRPQRLGLHDDAVHAGDLRGRVPVGGGARRHPGAAARADGSGARARPQLPRRDAARDPAAGAVQHAAEHAEPVRLDHQGDDARLRDQRARADVRGQPDQQPAADQAVPGLLHPRAHLLHRLLEPDAAGAAGSSGASPPSGGAWSARGAASSPDGATLRPQPEYRPCMRPGPRP